MKTALIFDPYLDTLGGGERYFFTFALGLLKHNYQVEIAWKNTSIISEAETRFGLDLSGLKINSEAYLLFSEKTSLKRRFRFTSNYDLIFWVSDGSLPFLFSKNNLIHFQVPFKKIGGHPLLNRLKLCFINQLVYNSEFTRRVIEKSLPGSAGFVLYPPIDTAQFTAKPKSKIIISVARFDSPSHSKRQDVLIRAFRDFNQKIKGYRLLLVGGLKGRKTLLDPLIGLAKGLPVEFVLNPDFSELKELYSKSSFFWHAAGYGLDEDNQPEKVEHFGMTTVEAMSAGAVPIVINKGGQKEIIIKGSGYLVDDILELSHQTQRLSQDLDLLDSFRRSAQNRAKKFSIDNFYQKISSLL